jgi:SAM-dependent methyltransferase
MTASEAGHYRQDLACIHDAGYGHFARAAAPVLREALRKRGLDSGLIVDLGCGSGILAAELSQAGYDLLGFDLSQSMIALACKRAPKARFHVQSLWEADLPPCIAVTAIGECFNYFFDQRNTDAALLRLFHRVYAALCPGGLFLFDVAEPGRVPGSGVQRHFREEEDWAVLVSTEEDRASQRLTRRITSFRKVGKLYRREQEVHTLRLFAGAGLARHLRLIGFRVRLLRNYGPLRFPPGYVALLGRKPGQGRGVS